MMMDVPPRVMLMPPSSPPDAQGRNRRLTNQGVHDGEQGNYAKHQRADQGQTRQNPHDVIGSGLADECRDCAVVLTKIICHFNRVVLNGAVEIGKEDDQQEVHTRIPPRVTLEGIKELLPAGALVLVSRNEHLHRTGRDKIEDAKMMGSTPLILILMGMWVD